MAPKKQRCQQEYERVINETNQGAIHPLKKQPCEIYTNKNACSDLLVPPEYNISDEAEKPSFTINLTFQLFCVK